MKINVKVISDIHFGKKDDRRLYDEIQKVFIPTIDDNLDLLVIAGDLFDRVIKMNEPASIYIVSLIDQLSKLSRIHNFKVRILKGTKTHDFNQLTNFKNYEDDTDRFAIIEEACIEELFGMEILYIPEEYLENPDEYYKDLFSSKVDLCFFHGTMDFAGFSSHIKHGKGSKHAPNFKSSQIADLVKGVAVGGHIHMRDSYKDKIYYTGSFSRFGFGEPENKGFIDYSYDNETNEVELNYINNDLAPMYVTYQLSDIDGTLEEKLETIESLKKEYENIRIQVSEEDKKGNDIVVETLKNLTDDKVKLQVKNSFEEQYDQQYDFILKKELSCVDTIKKYIKMTKDVDLDVKVIDGLIK